jgi:RNA polymerase sigma-70 factor (ECF subfamily)
MVEIPRMTGILSVAAVPTGTSADAGRLAMTEQEFRHFYAQTARPLKNYISRLTGQTDLADDLLQEAYYRMLRAGLPLLDARQQKNYIYKIATNLVRDHFRRRPGLGMPVEELQIADPRAVGSTAALDIQRVLSTINPREREMVWLAYVEGASHREISAITGVKEASVRPLLYRVRQKLAALLRDAGLGGESQ